MKTLFNLWALLGGILINILTRSVEWRGQAGSERRGGSEETGEFFCDDCEVQTWQKSGVKKEHGRERRTIIIWEAV